MDEESFEIEPDDTVMFAAESDYGIVQADGRVVRTFKNGSIEVEYNGRKYKTDKFELLRKAC